ncbi:MAG: uracil-DNA glycosylase [Chloroflexi bacterium]|nr:uracil-DNA glycosylase [Chloroflexota bacterium]
MEEVSELEQLHGEVRVCQLCILSQSRRNAVPGEGPEKVDILFVGEGPGFHEDQQGRPFVGPAGQFLNQLLEGIGIKREQVYITNVVKCRPPGNRDPLPEEIAACHPYLVRQISLLKPKLIVTLGRYSTEQFFPGVQISKIRGRPKKMGGIIYYPMFHPAAGLHQPRWRKVIEEDFARIPQLLKEAEKLGEDNEPPSDKAEQLSLL